MVIEKNRSLKVKANITDRNRYYLDMKNFHKELYLKQDAETGLNIPKVLNPGNP